MHGGKASISHVSWHYSFLSSRLFKILIEQPLAYARSAKLTNMAFDRKSLTTLEVLCSIVQENNSPLAAVGCFVHHVYLEFGIA